MIDVTKETKAKLELERNMRMQEEFFLNISHELKTPLNVIYTTTQLFDLYIKDGSLMENQDKLNKYVGIIKQNCHRQIKLVNNFVDLSKIQSDLFQLHLSNQDIVGVVENIVESVSEYVEAKGLRICFDTDMEEKVIACDPSNIERVVLNLISNAMKFSVPGDEIFVEVLNKNDTIELCVKDTGIGIDKDDLDEIFRRFKQVDKSLSRNAEGSGIGLCIVKSIVELHGGSIKVESEIGKGSRFIIELPNRTVKVPYSGRKNTRSKIETINIEFSDIYS
jgi:signal transduction histidine kinase